MGGLILQIYSTHAVQSLCDAGSFTQISIPSPEQDCDRFHVPLHERTQLQRLV